MRNSDMPAMPLSGDAYNDFAGYVPGKTSFNPECQGLTKREMFAMYAVQGLLAANSGWKNSAPMTNSEIAQEAVDLADDLLEALEK